MIRPVTWVGFVICLRMVASAWSGEESRPVAVQFAGADGTVHAGEVVARSAAGFTLKSADSEKLFRWDALGAETSFTILDRVLTDADGQAWLDAAYLLETLPDGPPWADKALDKTVAADPIHARAAEALRAERIWFSDNANDSGHASSEALVDPASIAPPARRTPSELGDHILAMAVDHQSQLWIGTEERGLWVENPAAPEDERWRSFRAPALDRAIPQTLPGRNGPLNSSTSMDIEQRLADKPKYHETPVVKLQPGDFPEDSVTALTVDKQGRVWAGHLRHGVSVWNGESWKTYEQGDGPLGHRVFSIKTNPLDGDVWIATEAGLSRYRLADDRWTNYTSDHGTDGPASHQVVAFAFDPNTGDLWTGYDAYGVGRAVRDEHGEYPVWQNFRAPASFPAAGPQGESARNKTWPMPNTPTGHGLPSDFVNDLVVDNDGAVWVATHTGLVWSRDHGQTWQYQRGLDWEARVKGLYQPPAPQWTCRPQDLWMPTDHVRQLVMDERGVLWAGFWRHPWRAIIPATGVPLPVAESSELESVDFASVLLPTDHGLLVGTYGQGVREINFRLAAGDLRLAAPQTASDSLAVAQSAERTAQDVGSVAQSAERTAQDVGSVAQAAHHPSPASIPSTDELAALLDNLKSIPASRQDTPMVPLPDDWRTRGDWLGRYGKYWSVLAALNAPQNYVWGAGEKPVRYRHFIGPHNHNRDSVRHWVSHLYTTDPRTLEMPPAYYDSRVKKGLALPHETRRQSEWDDHSETYPTNFNGPHLYCTLRVPEGEFILSLYNFNKDGLSAQNRFRDYPIMIRELPAGIAMTDLEGWDSRRELARGRFHDFRGGVWKRWLVKGPINLTIELQRNSSWSTILAGVMLDDLSAFPDPYFDQDDLPANLDKHSPSAPDATDAIDAFATAALTNDLSTALLDELDRLRLRNPTEWSRVEKRTLLALRRARDARRLDTPIQDVVVNNADGTVSTAPLPSSISTATLVTNARLNHALSRFDEYEDNHRALSLPTPRELEKSISWDDVSYTHAGMGRTMIQAARRARENQPNTNESETTLLANDDVAPATIHLSPREHDFGAVKAGEELKLTLEIIRPAPSQGTPLRLGRVMASCTCVTVSAPKRVFAENEKAEVFVTIKPNAQDGPQHYSVTAEILNEKRTITQADLRFITE